VRAFALELRFSDRQQEHRDLVAAALLDFDTAAVHEINDAQWRIFFRSREERDRARALLAGSYDVSPVEIEDEDWARRSQQDLKAIQVGDLLIAPPWDIPSSGEESERDWQLAAGTWQLIIIEPSTGFGTGHHATTRLCLRALQQMDLRGRRVLDVGTGSGVLAIAAAKLGAAQVLAVDNDPDAIDAARLNVRRNNVAVDLRLVDLERTSLPVVDVVLANLTGTLLQRAAVALASLSRGGVLIVSGLLAEEEAAVSRAFEPHAAHLDSTSEAGWVSLVVRLLPAITDPSSAPSAR
jgi:ribosomal protein L11 methyltransferase